MGIDLSKSDIETSEKALKLQQKRFVVNTSAPLSLNLSESEPQSRRPEQNRKVNTPSEVSDDQNYDLKSVPKTGLIDITHIEGKSISIWKCFDFFENIHSPK